MRLLSPSEAFANIPVCFTLSHYQSGGSTSMSPALIKKFADAGALIMPVLAEDISDPEALPDWVPLPNHGNPFIPRAYSVCYVVGPAGYAAATAGQPLDTLEPWKPSDTDAFIVIATVISQVRNGVARLVVALSEAMGAHPSFKTLREVMWYTRTAKGEALTSYFQGRPTGRSVTRTFANGKTQTMPIYTLNAADWQKQIDAVLAQLLDIEANFTEKLSGLHKKNGQS